MIENDANVKTVQDVLGHATYATTMNLYVHTTPFWLRDAMERGAKPTAQTAKIIQFRASCIGEYIWY